MNENDRMICGVISRLLDYPSREIADSYARIRQLVEDLSFNSKERLLDFLSCVERTPFITLQEEYTRTFDLNPELCLNLTFHKWGEDKKRSRDLIEIKEQYRDAGYETEGAELPDYLPMVLEFVSFCPNDAGFRLLEKHAEQIELLGVRLREVGSPYAKLIEITESFVPR